MRYLSFLCIIAAALELKNSNIYKNNRERYLQKTDSLINVYSDLQECGAFAIRKLNLILYPNNSNVQQAIEWIDEAISRWPKWFEINELKNRRSELTYPTMSISRHEEIITTTQEATFKLEKIRNISGFVITATPIVGLSSEEICNISFDNNKIPANLKNHLLTSKKISAQKEFGKHQDFEFFKDSISLGKLPLGAYLVEITCDGKELLNNKIIQCVSDLKVMTLRQGSNQIRYVVVNTTTGKPVGGANLHLKSEEGKDEKVVTVDENGEYILNFQDKNCPNIIYATTKEDFVQSPLWFSTYFYEHEKSEDNEHKIEIFTENIMGGSSRNRL